MHIPKTLLLVVAASALALSTPTTFAKDTDEAAKLREAMRQKLTETQGAQKAPAQAAPVQTAPATPAKSAAPAKQAAKSESDLAIGDSAEDAALREAMRSRMAEQPKATAAPAAPAATPGTKAPKTTAFQPLQAPPSPLTGSKEERLNQLLDQYKADQITPEEYHKQRAKIVAE